MSKKKQKSRTHSPPLFEDVTQSMSVENVLTRSAGLFRLLELVHEGSDPQQTLDRKDVNAISMLCLYAAQDLESVTECLAARRPL